MESQLEFKLRNIALDAKQISIEKNEALLEKIAKNTIKSIYSFFNDKEYTSAFPQFTFKTDLPNLLYCQEELDISRINLYTMKARVLIEETAHFVMFYDYYISKNRKINFEDILNFYSTKDCQHEIIGTIIKKTLKDEYFEFKKIKINDGQEEMIQKIEKNNYSLAELVSLEKNLIKDLNK
ncbi:MAG: hypothetical protein PHN56_04795 [Candidatus Nanoarchaeia archaeon]|nr:hypothetical protein [Candidatus Nanoarchaeia archaeon]